jgi:hypothetical protein
MTTEFLTCYDYRQGGVWAMLRADSKEQIQTTYPELTVFDEGTKPEWMSSEELERIRATIAIDIGDSSHAFLAALRRPRSS